jgi:hypothetical protein
MLTHSNMVAVMLLARTIVGRMKIINIKAIHKVHNAKRIENNIK